MSKLAILAALALTIVVTALPTAPPPGGPGRHAPGAGPAAARAACGLPDQRLLRRRQGAHQRLRGAEPQDRQGVELRGQLAGQGGREVLRVEVGEAAVAGLAPGRRLTYGTYMASALKTTVYLDRRAYARIKAIARAEGRAPAEPGRGGGAGDAEGRRPRRRPPING